MKASRVLKMNSTPLVRTHGPHPFSRSIETRQPVFGGVPWRLWTGCLCPWAPCSQPGLSINDPMGQGWVRGGSR